MAQRKFQFYEIVRIKDGNPELAEIHGERGVVIGIAEDDGAPEYGVYVHRDEMCWQVPEADLESKGESSSREALYGDESAVRVRLDETGRRQIVDE